MTTTIKIQLDTKHELDKMREYKNESYDEVIKKTLFIVKNCNNKLSTETLKQIQSSRSRLKKGKFLTEAEARKRLGL